MQVKIIGHTLEKEIDSPDSGFCMCKVSRLTFARVKQSSLQKQSWKESSAWLKKKGEKS